MSSHSATLSLAASLIGRPWRERACGPDAFDCWGLVRYFLAVAHGIDVGPIAGEVDTARAATEAAEATPEQVRAILAAAGAGGWRRADAAAPQPVDVALLRHGVTGLRHVGVLLQANGALQLLHCEGGRQDPTPGVVCEPLADALRRYHGLELWRLAC